MSDRERVLVTGAAGFIGAALTGALRGRGHEVVGVDRVADPGRGIVAGDVTAPEAWEDALRGCDVVVHAAAVVSNAVGLEDQWRVNVLGTSRVAAAAARAGVRRIVQLSSIRAFSDVGFPPGVTEEHPVRPDGNPYVDTKIAGEQVVLQAHAAGAIEACVVRPGDVYGPGSRPWVLLPLEAIRARQFLLPAMGRGAHSPVYVDDLVAGLVLAITRPAAAGQVVTITGPRTVTAAEYFGHLHRLLGRRGPLVAPTGAAIALAHVADGVNRLRGRRSEVNAVSMRYLARPGGYSIEKARRLLGYEPLVDLDEGMRRTGDWLRAEGLVA
ncbi:NAD-dependent epimerase/dehydratase family protein [Patulibacter brassicae]|uniref:NAD-dependent epimerase/dehydratase family protein n=1 Tax=Patulibacter brassicae TaxID=1705717 RepID=A0ABU4VPP3_9ACTN|nr:NAD-dependent epimerase/dehydratase family protein [Patulibacter brassicae]MDX8153834.1 NAD-dependent epimerase/dehydratase family protein [Patulibacter brassicae]